MLLVGFVAYFWAAQKEGVNDNAIAAKNVARMEAKVSGGSSAHSPGKPDTSKILEKFKETRESQLKYLMIIMMIGGIGFLAYSFLKKETK